MNQPMQAFLIEFNNLALYEYLAADEGSEREARWWQMLQRVSELLVEEPS